MRRRTRYPLQVRGCFAHRAAGAPMEVRAGRVNDSILQAARRRSCARWALARGCSIPRPRGGTLRSHREAAEREQHCVNACAGDAILSVAAVEISCLACILMPPVCACARPSAAPGDFRGMCGRSRAMQVLYEQICLTTRAAGPVLICGRSGVGKELITRGLHEKSDRAYGPCCPSTVRVSPKGCWRVSCSVTLVARLPARSG